MKPKISYTIWFSQRTGSTLLTTALEATGMAGKPGEWLNRGTDLCNEFHLTSLAEVQQHLWDLGSTENGIFGIKHSFYEPHFSRLMDQMRKIPTCPQEETNRPAVWEHAFGCGIFFRRHDLNVSLGLPKRLKTAVKGT